LDVIYTRYIDPYKYNIEIIFFYTTNTNETLHFVMLQWTYEFEHVLKCGKLQCWSNILRNYVRDVDIYTKVQSSVVEWIFVDLLRDLNYMAKSTCKIFRTH
jgi:hypothetical protein